MPDVVYPGQREAALQRILHSFGAVEVADALGLSEPFLEVVQKREVTTARRHLQGVDLVSFYRRFQTDEPLRPTIPGTDVGFSPAG